MEAPEKGSTAEAVASFFQRGEHKASAHYCVDADSIVQCVQCKDVAYGAPGANHNGIHIELAGYASQSAEDWADPYSDQMLKLAATLVGQVLVPKFEIPVRFLLQGDLLAKKSGITTHRLVSQAFRKSTHTDPGANFPTQKFINYVMQSRNGTLK